VQVREVIYALPHQYNDRGTYIPVDRSAQRETQWPHIDEKEEEEEWIGLGLKSRMIRTGSLGSIDSLTMPSMLREDSALSAMTTGESQL